MKEHPALNAPYDSLTYQQPPNEILDLVDVARVPFVQVDRKGRYALFIHRDSYPSLASLYAPEMRLAGLRVNPQLNIGSRETYYINIQIKNLETGELKEAKGLPNYPRLTNFTWSRNQTKLAFTHSTDEGVQAWYLDLETAEAHCLTAAQVNANLEHPLTWMQDEASLLIKLLPEVRPELQDADKKVPAGPTISESEGTKAQNRTYQDLLKTPTDIHNFIVLGSSVLHRVYLDGRQERWLEEAALFRSCLVSPNGNYVLVTTLEQPFSYSVPYSRFPQYSKLYTADGAFVETVNKVPLIEEIPQGFMSVRKGRRLLRWRGDHPASLTWAEALDEGDASKEVPYRDAVYFCAIEGQTSEPQLLLKTVNRFDTIEWGTDNLAVAHDYWWNTRNTKVYLFDPSDASVEPRVVIDRNYQDEYNDPGHFIVRRNQFGCSVLHVQNNQLYLMGEGRTAEGHFPFVDRMDLTTLEKERLYQSTYTDRMEQLYFPLDLEKGKFLVRIQSPTAYPNYYIRHIYEEEVLEQITDFKNPFSSLQEVHKEVIRYKRSDGVQLSGTLYLPVGYDLEQPEKKPLIIWAYPKEYKDNNSAGQVLSNPNEFIYPYYGSMVYWVTRGYVVLDDAAFPIVGENEEEPNDTFIEQLVDNARAAIDTLDERGYIDRERVAVAGHSYGAFMTANLLSHSDLFAAGIARSGAYNRTLTPFGFQSEERNYWETPETYHRVSPFMSADKMKTPLLLIHGAADNNSGTYPLQSKRYFDALRGLGAITRLVLLPKESHGYVARESILHLLWEQDRWLEKYVKNMHETTSTEKDEKLI
jgi:dipeptidyl aminopeptidase/acylaminoacyl peptidase